MKCDVADPWMQGSQADGLGMAGLLGDHWGTKAPKHVKALVLEHELPRVDQSCKWLLDGTTKIPESIP